MPYQNIFSNIFYLSNLNEFIWDWFLQGCTQGMRLQRWLYRIHIVCFFTYLIPYMTTGNMLDSLHDNWKHTWFPTWQLETYLIPYMTTGNIIDSLHDNWKLVSLLFKSFSKPAKDYILQIQHLIEPWDCYLWRVSSRLFSIILCELSMYMFSIKSPLI